MDRPPKVAPDEVKRRLLLILKQGRLTYTWHCQHERMLERGVTTQDVEYVLEVGEVSEDAEWSDTHQLWKYKVDGTDLEGEDLRAIFVIIESHLMARVITIF